MPQLNRILVMNKLTVLTFALMTFVHTKEVVFRPGVSPVRFPGPVNDRESDRTVRMVDFDTSDIDLPSIMDSGFEDDSIEPSVFLPDLSRSNLGLDPIQAPAILLNNNRPVANQQQRAFQPVRPAQNVPSTRNNFRTPNIPGTVTFPSNNNVNNNQQSGRNVQSPPNFKDPLLISPGQTVMGTLFREDVMKRFLNKGQTNTKTNFVSPLKFNGPSNNAGNLVGKSNFQQQLQRFNSQQQSSNNGNFQRVAQSFQSGNMKNLRPLKIRPGTMLDDPLSEFEFELAASSWVPVSTAFGGAADSSSSAADSSSSSNDQSSIISFPGNTAPKGQVESAEVFVKSNGSPNFGSSNLGSSSIESIGQSSSNLGSSLSSHLGGSSSNHGSSLSSLLGGSSLTSNHGSSLSSHLGGSSSNHGSSLSSHLGGSSLTSNPGSSLSSHLGGSSSNRGSSLSSNLGGSSLDLNQGSSLSSSHISNVRSSLTPNFRSVSIGSGSNIGSSSIESNVDSSLGSNIRSNLGSSPIVHSFGSSSWEGGRLGVASGEVFSDSSKEHVDHAAHGVAQFVPDHHQLHHSSGELNHEASEVRPIRVRPDATKLQNNNGPIENLQEVPEVMSLLSWLYNCSSTDDGLGFCEQEHQHFSNWVTSILKRCERKDRELLIKTLGQMQLQDEPKASSPASFWDWKDDDQVNPILRKQCAVQRRSARPVLAKDVKSQWRIVLQSDKIRQIVPVTVCRTRGSSCSDRSGSPVARSKCVQEFSSHKLVTLNVDGSENCIATHEFKLPSACSCGFVPGIGPS